MSALVSLEAENLSCIRGGRLVFRGLDFRAERGAVLSIEGANGAGKSSLLRILAGFLSPAGGAISFETADGVVEDGEERAKFIGWLGHHDAIKPQLTPRETLAFYARLYTAPGDIEGVLRDVGLARAADLPCQYLSAGQKRRLGLARLKITARILWLLDEPLAALDEAGKALLRGWIADHSAGGGIALAATHEPLGVDCTRLVLA